MLFQMVFYTEKSFILKFTNTYSVPKWLWVVGFADFSRAKL